MKPAKLAELEFNTRPVSNNCEWPGTEWVTINGKQKLLNCGEPTVGMGLFLNVDDKHGGAYSLCERHADRPIEESHQDTAWSSI